MLDQDKTGYACKLMKKTNTDTSLNINDTCKFKCGYCKISFELKANLRMHQKCKHKGGKGHGKRSKANNQR